MAKLVKQHDEIAKVFLTDLPTAREFLQIHLDPKLKAKCDFSTLTIESGSYLDSDLRKRFADIVYKMDLLDKTNCVYVYMLVEHQGKAEELMPLRVLRYVLAILQNHVNQYKVLSNLPMVVPLILYNGKDSPYPYKTDIRELFADQDMIKQFPIGSFSLIDLTILPDEAILQHGKVALLEMLQKHIHIRDFTKVIDLILGAVLAAHEDKISKHLFDGALSYMINGREGKDLKPLFLKIIENISEYEGDIMSYADELRREGEQRGEQRGEQKASLEIARNLLKAGVDERTVKETTHLSEPQILDLKKSLQ